MSESLCSRLQFTINRLEECSTKTWAQSHGTGRCLLFLPRTSHGGKPERMALCAHEEALGEGLELGKPVILMHHRGYGAVCVDHQALPVDVLPDALPRRDVPVCVKVCMNACVHEWPADTGHPTVLTDMSTYPTVLTAPWPRGCARAGTPSMPL